MRTSSEDGREGKERLSIPSSSGGSRVLHLEPRTPPTRYAKRLPGPPPRDSHTAPFMRSGDRSVTKDFCGPHCLNVDHTKPELRRSTKGLPARAARTLCWCSILQLLAVPRRATSAFPPSHSCSSTLSVYPRCPSSPSPSPPCLVPPLPPPALWAPPTSVALLSSSAFGRPPPLELRRRRLRELLPP